MNFLFLMDPLETVVFEKDTSFILMLGAHRRGHEVYFLPGGGMVFKDGHVQFHVQKVTPQSQKDYPFVIEGNVVLSDTQVDVLFIRTDPPFDGQYLLNTWLIDLLPEKIAVINNSKGIRSANEKLWALNFPGLVPATLAASRKDELLAFVKDQQDVIAKPINGYGGQSIFRLKSGDTNVNVILETLTKKWSLEIILQAFVPESDQGDKRILLLNGEPLGAVLRVHAPGEHRNNFFSGGKPAAAEISVRDQEIISGLKPKLKELGLYFVGIDIIGDYLIEVNVTSPTCLQEINRLNHVQLEDKVIDFVENFGKLT